MTKRIITTGNAPAAIGPYSQAVEVDNTLYMSGQIPLDPDTGNITGSDITAQTQQVMENIREWNKGTKLSEAEERGRMVEALRKYNGNKSKAARILGISRQTLREKTKLYTTDEDDIQVSSG